MRVFNVRKDQNTAIVSDIHPGFIVVAAMMPDGGSRLYDKFLKHVKIVYGKNLQYTQELHVSVHNKLCFACGR